tara:strand:+ start:476 stop:937 length:462 start_codon:yes stop_codon:yes gene_type:complete
LFDVLADRRGFEFRDARTGVIAFRRIISGDVETSFLCWLGRNFGTSKTPVPAHDNEPDDLEARRGPRVLTEVAVLCEARFRPSFKLSGLRCAEPVAGCPVCIPNLYVIPKSDHVVLVDDIALSVALIGGGKSYFVLDAVEDLVASEHDSRFGG